MNPDTRQRRDGRCQSWSRWLLPFLAGFASSGIDVSAASFASPGQIVIPLVGAASPYPVGLVVSNLSGEITSVDVTLSGLTHTAPGDLDIVLASPTGQSVVLMSDAGASNVVDSTVLTFSDSATAVLPQNGRILKGVYRPTNYGSGDVFPTPAPPAPLASVLAAFNGKNPNGLWRLFVVDDQSPHNGVIAGGWRLDINTTNFPPVILKQPPDLTVAPGTVATFQVDVGGTPPFGYQWLHNGAVFIPFGQGTDTLTLRDVQPSDAGIYSVVVTNATGAAGAAASRNAQLNVLGPLAIIAITKSVVAAPGDDVLLEVNAAGTPPIQYQWTLNGARLPGQTNRTLLLPKVGTTNGGRYEIVIWNDADAVVSKPIGVRVRGPTEPLMADKFDLRPRVQLVQAVVQGDTTDFRVELGERPLEGGGQSAWLEWIAPQNGVVTFSTHGSAFDTLLAVYTGSALGELKLVTMDDDSGPSYTSELRFNARAGVAYEILLDGVGIQGSGGEYNLSWGYGRDQSPVPVILSAPASRAVADGDSVTFRIQTDSANDTFQWFRDGVVIPKEVGNSFTIPAVKTTDVAVYRVGIITAFGRLYFGPPFELQVGSRGLKLIQNKYEAMYFSSGDAGFLSIGLGNAFLANVPSSAEHGIGDPTPCGGPFFGTLWQGLTATNTGLIQVDTIGSGMPARLAVYRLTGGPDDFFYPPIICDLTSASNGLPAVARFTATQGTNYTVILEGSGGTLSNLTLNTKMGIAPALAVSPQYCLVASHGSFTLTMPATNWFPLPSCQWLCNGTNIPNATNASLTVTGFSAARIGTYSVTMSNFVRAATTVMAYLDLAGPLTVGHAWVGSGATLGFKLYASNSSPFKLETTTNILGPWSPVATNPDPCAILFFTNGSPALDAQRFFRAAPWSPP